MLMALDFQNLTSAPTFEDYKLAAITGGGSIGVDKLHGIDNTKHDCVGVAKIDIGKILHGQVVAGWYHLFDPDTYQSEGDCT